MYSDLLILAPAAIVFVVLILLSRRQAAPDVDVTEDGPPDNAIVVDGSNVMYWSGKPSLKVLAGVLRSIEKAGYAPIVFFDANVGYKVGERYYTEETLAPLIKVRFDHICVVSSGVVADESILMFATDHGLRIVTNDQFRDWRVKFPHAAKKGTLVRGKWHDGSVKWARPFKA
ncbi:hypothetical protein FHS72_000658 [Loktanella ponticola]|uniref:RNase NYN domain-containing protein n=1 Tax=Yoonia ponticola TaxID=1524255 RepID=A0A7W9BIQ8_9RHOB|nr:hypothetical protein [Yoonia ponticola]MBB5721051.1 hypothetical protein [Yoonia ponticola]